MSYDSTEDTNKHIANVRYKLLLVIRHLTQVVKDLVDRSVEHDASKLLPPEKEVYDKYTPLLANTEYGSDAYKRYLTEMNTGVEHHWMHNDHHPEYYPTGIDGMNLVSLLEMLIDWKAASERHKTGNIRKSIEKNIERFHIEPQLAQIIRNTLEYMKW